MKNRFSSFAAVYMLIPAMLLAQPTGKKQLVGVWAVKETPVEQSQSPLLSLAMFGGDSSFSAGVGSKALPPIPVVQDVATELGPGYGRWAATGDREFRLTFYAVMRKAGLVNGFQRVQNTLAVSESGDEYSGHAQVDFLDADWNVVFSTTRDVKGTRLETPTPSRRRAGWKERVSGGVGSEGVASRAVGVVSVEPRDVLGVWQLHHCWRIQGAATCSRGSGCCERNRTRVWLLGHRGRWSVPAHLLRGDAEGGLRTCLRMHEVWWWDE
jgi:hypothetical protein